MMDMFFPHLDMIRTKLMILENSPQPQRPYLPWVRMHVATWETYQSSLDILRMTVGIMPR